MSVASLLSFVRCSPRVKETQCERTSPSPPHQTVISCETILIAFSLSDRQADMSYNLFSTYPACIVFDEQRRIQRHRNLSRVCSVVLRAFYRQRKLSENQTPHPSLHSKDDLIDNEPICLLRSDMLHHYFSTYLRSYYRMF